MNSSQQFAGTYLHTAQLVSSGTGIDPFVLLAQWANETDWGNVVVGNNLGNIRCSPTSFCQYATLDDFAAACIVTFHNGYYLNVLAAVGAAAQLAAIVASPWASGHYGGSITEFYQQLPIPVQGEDMHPSEKYALVRLAKFVYTGKVDNDADIVSAGNGIADDGSNADTIIRAIQDEADSLAGKVPATPPVAHVHLNDGADPLSAKTGPGIPA
jgi:hypothetical protein